ncbi:MAG: Pyridoxamine 5'-phosphate oxidase, partial [uncultured Sphingomonas sp.]
GRRPVCPVRLLVRRSSGERAQRSRRDGHCHRHRGRAAVGPHGAVAQSGARGLRLLHQSRQPQGRGDRGQPPRRTVHPLEVAAPAGAGGRAAGAGRRCGGRRVFRRPGTAEPDRLLGVGPVAPARKPRAVPRAIRRGGGAVRRPGRAPSAALVRLPPGARRYRVLGRPRAPPPRAAAVHPPSGGRLERRAALPM